MDCSALHRVDCCITFLSVSESDFLFKNWKLGKGCWLWCEFLKLIPCWIIYLDFFQLESSVQLFLTLLILWYLCWIKRKVAVLLKSFRDLDLKVGFSLPPQAKSNAWIYFIFHSCFIFQPGVWKGLFARIIMIGTLTALQWFIYDSVKVYFRLPRPPPPEMPESLKKKLGLTQ